MTTTKKTAHQILADPEFKALATSKDRISMVLTIIELVMYFGFVGLVAFNKPFLAQKLSSDSVMTIGIPIAVGTIFFSWVLTGIYIYWANNTYDPGVKRVKDQMQG